MFGAIILLVFLLDSISKRKTSNKKKKIKNIKIIDNSRKTTEYKTAKKLLKKITKNNYKEILANEECFSKEFRTFTSLDKIMSKIYYKISKFDFLENNSFIPKDLEKISSYRENTKNKPYSSEEDTANITFSDLIEYNKGCFKIGEKPVYMNDKQKGAPLSVLEKKLIGAYLLKQKRLSEYNEQKRLKELKIQEEKRLKELAELHEKQRQKALKEEELRLKREYQHGYRDDMNGYEYEKYCADLFSYFGWNAKATIKSGDYGVDVIAVKNGIKIVAQCKHYSGNVGFDAVKEASTGKIINSAKYALVITNSSYTPSAKEGAKKTGVILLRHSVLEQWLESIDIK